MGKGDWKREMNKKRFDEGFERVFGKKELKRWNPEDDGLDPPEPKIVQTDEHGFEYDENGGVHYPITLDITIEREKDDGHDVRENGDVVTTQDEVPESTVEEGNDITRTKPECNCESDECGTSEARV